MSRPAAILASIALLVLGGCQFHQHDPYTQEYVVTPEYSVEYEYSPPGHPDAHVYTDHDGHRYHEAGLSASHGGYGAYGVLLED